MSVNTVKLRVPIFATSLLYGHRIFGLHLFRKFYKKVDRAAGQFPQEIAPPHDPPLSTSEAKKHYSIFGMGVDRMQDAKCLFSHEKGTLHTT
jgi:hypothetical protein